MSTASRHSVDPSGLIRGEKSLAALSKQYSSRDLPSHTKLKYRKHGQSSSDELRAKDFKRELIEKERSILYEKEKKSSTQPSRLALLPPSTSKKPRLEGPSNPDADDKRLLADSDDDDDDDDDDEDDTAELLAELNRIKQERAAEEAKKEAERKEQEEKIRLENILKGNPLLNSNKTEFKVKRRWDDDVVFKNCARSESDSKGRSFINDTLRSEFHKKFMEKYIK